VKPLIAALALLASSGVAAQPVKCVDAKGHVRYIDQSMMGQESCTPVTATTNTVSTQPGAIKPPPPAPAAPGNEAAVAAAEAKLAAAKKALADQEAIRIGGERNYERMLERLKPYQEAVDTAQKELDAARQGGR